MANILHAARLLDNNQDLRSSIVYDYFSVLPYIWMKEINPIPFKKPWSRRFQSFFLNYTRSTGTSFKNSVGAPTLTARSNAGEATWVVPECAY